MKLSGFLRIIFERQGPEKGTLLFLLSFIYICIYFILFYWILVNATLTLLDLIFIYLIYFNICVYHCDFLNSTALLELGTQTYRYTHNNIS